MEKPSHILRIENFFETLKVLFNFKLVFQCLRGENADNQSMRDNFHERRHFRWNYVTLCTRDKDFLIL